MEHLFPGNAGKGSSRSDFVAATLGARGVLVPFFIVEFEASGHPTHKDDRVCVAEGVFEMSQLVGKLNVSKSELGQLAVYLGFANDAKIGFDVLSPCYDEMLDTIYYQQQKRVSSFDLSNSETSIREALDLLAFIQTRVTPAGELMRELICTRSGPSEVGHLLPTLPAAAEKSSTNSSAMTPANKLIKVQSKHKLPKKKR
ncbi:hypothetical protein BJ741DRAFT_387306 [Chytriomyces cf. hyalinus JEL632]|nr:hypothetical protein BJ741DRAFT_387306 [Chytriomyces cf. hyalinus JEL632]